MIDVVVQFRPDNCSSSSSQIMETRETAPLLAKSLTAKSAVKKNENLIHTNSLLAMAPLCPLSSEGKEEPISPLSWI